MCGWHWFGWAGLIVGVMTDMYALAEAMAWSSRELLPITVKEIRKYLHSDDCRTLNLVLLELNRRKEDVSSVATVRLRHGRLLARRYRYQCWQLTGVLKKITPLS